MWLIILLVVVGVLFLVAELVLLPGLSVAGFCAMFAYGAAIYIAFTKMGTTAGFIVIAIVIAVSVAAMIISLKAKTWQRFSLKNRIDSTAQQPPQLDVKIRERAVTVTRLAPMGKVMVGNKTFEAKSIDAYIDPRKEVEIVGFENFNVIVKSIN